MNLPEDQKVELEKAVIKKAIEEWLDKQFAKFGRWSLGALAALFLAWMLYGWLTTQGWHK